MRAVLLVGLVACGGGQGGGAAVRGDTLIVELTAEQRDDVCDEAVGILGEPHEARCGSDVSRDVGSLTHELCLSLLQMFEEGCEATVADYQACNRDVAKMTDQEICSGLFPATCEPLNECVLPDA
jgi:hypothetical protein